MEVKILLEELEKKIETRFPNVEKHISWHISQDHAELWVYFLNLVAFDEAQTFCKDLEAQINNNYQLPKIWIVVKSWDRPWPGGEEEMERRARRREEFKQKHGILTTAR